LGKEREGEGKKKGLLTFILEVPRSSREYRGQVSKKRTSTVAVRREKKRSLSRKKGGPSISRPQKRRAAEKREISHPLTNGILLGGT